MFCDICNDGIDYHPSMFSSNHLSAIHNISNKDYYDKYLRSENEGFCLVCGKETHFLGIGRTKGYRKCCSSKCSNNLVSKKNKTKETLIEKYGDENYVNVNKMKETNIIRYGNVCSVHNDLISKNIKENRNKHKFDRISKIIEKEDCEIIDVDSQKNYKLKCNKCNNEFVIDNQTFYLRNKHNVQICLKCNPSISYSISENLLFDFIKENYSGEILENSRQIISPYELDIYLPELKLAFEFNGLYWHNELYKENNYHLNKTNKCEGQGIHLIHIYEDDWMFKQDIVKSRILNLLDKSEVIYGRKCEIKEVTSKESKQFLKENHLMGSSVDKIRLGLYFKDELVSLMTFGKLRKNLGFVSKEGSFELIRFCNKLNHSVIGGANKLFKYFKEHYNPIEIISYADRSWTMNNGKSIYDRLKFSLLNKTSPNYHYINNRVRMNRFGYRKDVLVKEGYDKTKTEHEIMLDRKIYRIYDSGQLKFKY